MEMEYKCERCGFVTDQVRSFILHLERKNICEDANHCNKTLDILRNEFYIKSGFNWECQYCKQKFRSQSNLCQHRQHCSIYKDEMKKNQDEQYRKELQNLKNENSLLRAEIDELKNKNNNSKSLYDEIQTLKKQNKTLMSDMNSQKAATNKTAIEPSSEPSLSAKATEYNKTIIKYHIIRKAKTEEFYQAVLELYFGYGHKNLISGITDITTPNMHVEIKIWKEWYSGLGQIMHYMNMNPKPTARLYLIGDITDGKKHAIQTIINSNILPYNLSSKDNQVIITNLVDDTQEIITIRQIGRHACRCMYYNQLSRSNLRSYS